MFTCINPKRDLEGFNTGFMTKRDEEGLLSNFAGHRPPAGLATQLLTDIQVKLWLEPPSLIPEDNEFVELLTHLPENFLGFVAIVSHDELVLSIARGHQHSFIPSNTDLAHGQQHVFHEGLMAVLEDHALGAQGRWAEEALRTIKDAYPKIPYWFGATVSGQTFTSLDVGDMTNWESFDNLRYLISGRGLR